jgi:hypothetical protein
MLMPDCGHDWANTFAKARSRSILSAAEGSGYREQHAETQATRIREDAPLVVKHKDNLGEQIREAPQTYRSYGAIFGTQQGPSFSAKREEKPHKDQQTHCTHLSPMGEKTVMDLKQPCSANACWDLLVQDVIVGVSANAQNGVPPNNVVRLPDKRLPHVARLKIRGHPCDDKVATQNHSEWHKAQQDCWKDAAEDPFPEPDRHQKEEATSECNPTTSRKGHQKRP